jgi:DNA-binding MarR family transcriptional regulator
MIYKIEQIADVLFEITKNLKKMTEKSLKDYGIGIGQLQVLLMFYREPNQLLSQNDLVRALKVDKGNISRNVANLMGKGFIELSLDKSRHYRLSQDGLKMKDIVMSYFINTHHKMIKGIGEDELMTTLLCLLKMNENLEDM